MKVGSSALWRTAALLPLLSSGCPSDAGPPPASVSTTSDSSSEGSSTTSSTTGAPDELPPAPQLSSPADGALGISLETELCWEQVEDPEGEALAYRVFVDGAPLGDGILGEGEQPSDGFEGPCSPPLLFSHERSYTWSVEAFELDDPSRSSARSETWSFTTVGDGMSEQVFSDDFEQPTDWELSGDALDGQWVRGTPELAFDGEARSQPSLCPQGDNCFYTGPNPEGMPQLADVDGGETVLVSPPFDLSRAGPEGGAAVRLQRFFYKSSLVADASLRIELLVPSEPDAEDYEVHLLERHEGASMSEPLNAWEPVEYVACGVPMRAGSRLRIVAADLGTGVLEAAIDTVSVHAFDDPSSICAPGLGARCEPGLTPSEAGSCAPEQLCCSQGVVDQGVYRCETPVAGLDFDNPTAAPEEPGNGPPGCDAPDLIVEVGIPDLLFTDIFMDEASCELLEGCVGAPGWRTVMLFTMAAANVGARDLALGVPANLPELFHYSPCHDHYHFDEFARYELLDGDTVVARGHKQAFCLLDTISWAWPLALGQFDCINQGISRGFSDFYEAGLPCQWVDVTGVPPGDYTLRIVLNEPRPEHAQPTLVERDYLNNTLELPVTLPG